MIFINNTTKQTKEIKDIKRIITFEKKDGKNSDAYLINELLNIDESIVKSIILENNEWVEKNESDWAYIDYKYRILVTPAQLIKILSERKEIIDAIYAGVQNPYIQYADNSIEIYINNFLNDSFNYIKNIVGCKIENRPEILNITINE